MAPIVILSAARTPLGSFQGSLSGVPAPRLGAAAIKGAIARAGVGAGDVTDVIMGNVLQAGLGQAPARQACLYAGLPPSVRAVTVHKVCGSGLQAALLGAHALGMGDASLVVAGGMENMSASPYLLPKAREGYRMGDQQVVDSMIRDGLWDPYNDLHMGACAEQCAREYAFSREEQDAYACESFRRANAAQEDGRLAQEIIPVEVTDAKGKRGHGRQGRGPGKGEVREDTQPAPGVPEGRHDHRGQRIEHKRRGGRARPGYGAGWRAGGPASVGAHRRVRLARPGSACGSPRRRSRRPALPSGARAGAPPRWTCGRSTRRLQWCPWRSPANSPCPTTG